MRQHLSRQEFSPILAGRVAVLADTGAEPLHFRNEGISIEVLEVFVHVGRLLLATIIVVTPSLDQRDHRPRRERAMIIEVRNYNRW
jgi:hypothetical protein